MAVCTEMMDFIRENEDVRHPLIHKKNEWIIEKAKKIYFDWESERGGGTVEATKKDAESIECAENKEKAEKELSEKAEKFLDSLEKKGELPPYVGMKRILIYDVVLEKFQVFKTIKEAEENIGISKQTISGIIRNKRLTKSRYRAFYINRGQVEVDKKAIKEKVIEYVKEKVEVGPYLAQKNVKALVKYDLKTEEISVFESSKNAAIADKTTPGQVYNALSGEKILGGSFYYYLDKVA